MFSQYEYLFLAIFLSFSVGLAAGWLGSYLRWSMVKSLALGLECRLEELEGRMTREVKIRAQQASKTSKDLDSEIIALAAAKGGTGKSNGLSLEEWRNKAYTRGT